MAMFYTGVLYGVTSAGYLLWYRHDGWADGTDAWANGGGGKIVGYPGDGWETYPKIVPAFAGLMFALAPSQLSPAYYHSGWADGSDAWNPDQPHRLDVGIGTQVNAFPRISPAWLFGHELDKYSACFLTGASNCYFFAPDGVLTVNPGQEATKTFTIGSGWNIYTQLFPMGDRGVFYGITPGGELRWYRHDGWFTGADVWTAGDGGKQVGTGWNRFEQVLPAMDGVIYGITGEGELHWHRHTGWTDGTDSWHQQSGASVGSGWKIFKTAFAMPGGDGTRPAPSPLQLALLSQHSRI
jgi:hypothetical protein